jgi:hypothetical protein
MMYERQKGRGPRTELYLVSDIVNALNAVSVLTGDNQILDSVAAQFGLQRQPQYRERIEVFDWPALPAGREARR